MRKLTWLGKLVPVSCLPFRTGAIWVMAAAIATPNVTGGGQAVRTPRVGTLTLQEALSLAEKNNPNLHVATAQIEGARSGVVTAKAWPNPEINLFTGRQNARLLGAVPGFMQHFSVSQPIERSGVRRARIEAAELAREGSEHLLRAARLNIRGAVKQAFFDVLRRRAEIELAQENLRLIEDLRRRVQVQVQVGEAARLEMTRAEAEVATARTFARSAELRLITAISLLRAAISAPLDANIEPLGSLPPAPVLPPLEDLRRTVTENHPLLFQAQAEILRAEARFREQQASRQIQPSLYSEYEHQPDLGYFRMGISIPIPIWNRRQGPIGEAAAEVKRAQALSQARRLEILAALERSYGQYEVAWQQVESFQQGVLQEAEAALAAAEAAYKFGERGILEVLDAQRVLRTVRMNFLDAQYDRQAALIDLEQLGAIDDKGVTP